MFQKGKFNGALDSQLVRINLKIQLKEIFIVVLEYDNVEHVKNKLSTTCSNGTEVANWATPSCSRPQPATDNSASNCRSN